MTNVEVADLCISVPFHFEDVLPRASVQSHWGRLNLEIILWFGLMAVKIYDQSSACVGVQMGAGGS